MKVTVIIPAYNYSIYLEECINSVYGQSYKNIECIVVNDGSTDNTEKILEDLKKIKYQDLIIVNKENAGLSAARNTGIKIASGVLIAFLDADDLWAPNKIENQIKTFNERNADIVFSNYKIYQNSQLRDHSEKIIASPFILDFIAKNPILGSSSSIIIKSEVIRKVGYFDNNFRSGEDADYWFRCACQNFSFAFCDSHDVYIRHHQSGNMSANHMRMLSYHLILFDKQMNVVKESYSEIMSRKEFRYAIDERLSKIRWYAIQIEKYEYSLLTILMGIRWTGLKYLFSVNIFRRFISDIYILSKGLRRR